jgi:hypothetical protein
MQLGIEPETLLQVDIVGWEKAVARTETAVPSRAPIRVGAGPVSAVTVLVLLVLWWIAARQALVSPVFLPGPSAVLQQAIAVTRDGYVDSTLLQHIAASLGRVLAALLVVLIIGVPVGLAMGLARSAGIFDPIIGSHLIRRSLSAARHRWLGIGEPSKIVVIAIAMLAPITIATLSGVRSVPSSASTRAFDGRSAAAGRPLCIPAEHIAVDPDRSASRSAQAGQRWSRRN